MRRMLTLEFKRAFSGKGFAAAVLIGCAIAMHHAWMTFSGNDYLAAFSVLAAKRPWMNQGIDVIWYSWMGSSGWLFNGYLFLLILPILASLPYGGSLMEDISTGFLGIALTHVRARVYYAAKLIVAFFSGAVVAIVPLVLDFLLLMLKYPVVDPIAGSGHAVGSDTGLFVQLFYWSPVAWLAASIAVCAVCGGLFAMLSLAVARISRHALIVHMLPFLVLYVISTALDALGLGAMGLFTLMNPQLNQGEPLALMAWVASMALVAIVPCVLAARRRSVLG